jgi:hypothetical protein
MSFYVLMALTVWVLTVLAVIAICRAAGRDAAR